MHPLEQYVRCVVTKVVVLLLQWLCPVKGWSTRCAPCPREGTRPPSPHVPGQSPTHSGPVVVQHPPRECLSVREARLSLSGRQRKSLVTPCSHLLTPITPSSMYRDGAVRGTSAATQVCSSPPRCRPSRRATRAGTHRREGKFVSAHSSFVLLDSAGNPMCVV